MVSRRDQISDAKGSRELIDEHAGNLVYQIDRLLDIIEDLEAELERKDTIIADKESVISNLESQVAHGY